MAFDQNTYILNKNNNTATISKNADGTYLVSYQSLDTTDGTTNVTSQIVNINDILAQQTSTQTSLANLSIFLDDLRSLG